MQVKKYLNDFKKKFDLRLDTYLVKKQKQAQKITPRFSKAIKEIRRLNQAGGKRIRPALIYTAFKACGGRVSRQLWQTCMAMELIQAFALLHDDIMDDTQERRGEITCFKKLGLNKAILTGDVALILSEELIPHKIQYYFDQMKWELAAGQWLDIDHGQQVKANLKFKILELKTAMYTIARPLQIGAALANASPKILKSLFDYGKNVGIAFQMKDDVLDAEIGQDDLQKYLKKAVVFSQKGKKALKNVKIRRKEKEFLLGMADYVIKRGY